MKRLAILLFLLATAPAIAHAQTPIRPGQVISFEIDPGKKQESATSPNLINRPDANLVFEYRVDAATNPSAQPFAAVKAVPCTPVSATSVILTCRLVAPALTPGSHPIEVRALASPAEAGVNPSGYSTPLAVISIIITAPGTPTAVRITDPPAQ